MNPQMMIMMMMMMIIAVVVTISTITICPYVVPTMGLSRLV
jgi:hypothetical protein